MSQAYRVPLRLKILRPLIKWVFRTIFHILGRVKITGLENIPYGKPYVVAMNHISIYDPPFIAAFWPEMLEIIGASEVFERPGQAEIVKLYGVMPVQRGEYDRALLTKIIRIIRSGNPFLIAPEGGRSHVPAMRRAQPGIAYIVDATGVPVIPVGLVGTTDDFWQRAKRGERPKLEMRIGRPFNLPPINEKGAARRVARQRNADLVMQHLAGLLPEEYRGVYAETAISPTQTRQ
ncbi:MAG: lysophospholipid acyltransferase family protein [Anaerolineales bacterium]